MEKEVIGYNADTMMFTVRTTVNLQDILNGLRDSAGARMLSELNQRGPLDAADLAKIMGQPYSFARTRLARLEHALLVIRVKKSPLLTGSTRMP
jgi:hypothetical protein